MQKEWYREQVKDVLFFFNTSAERGLTEARVLDQRRKFGENVLSEEKTRSVRDIFISQFKSPLIYVLIVAVVIVLILGDYVDGGIILFIIFLNSFIGTIQEGRAQNTLAALKKVVKSYATVIRNGEEKRIPDHELVPGDIVLLKDGEAVGADARVVESNSLKINESSLTGESSVVLKNIEPIAATSLSATDQENMVFRGTYVVSGLAKVVVVRTGVLTVIGKISRKLTALNIDVPLKKNINNLSKLLVIKVAIASVVIFFVGLAADYNLVEMFTTVVAVAVSAIPESLPVVVTLVLATGVWRMSRQKVLVKRLQAVEALGQANVIALDKTGTITKNQMVVEKIYVDGRTFEVSGLGYEPVGKMTENKKGINPSRNTGLDLVLKISSFTAIAEIDRRKDDGEWVLEYGDPTEAALLVLAKKFGYDKDRLLMKYPQILEIPFNMKNKHHTTVNSIGNGKMLSVAGGPEVILSECSKVFKNGQTKKMSEADKAEVENALVKLSKEGYRILALAMHAKPPQNINPDNLPDLTFVGFVAITDAIRPEVESSVKSVRAAGMRVLMITGDFVDTAKAIAKKVGIFRAGDRVITGVEMKEMDDKQLESVLEKATVFARVTPGDKLRIIEAYKRRGQTIAMTGDGVNDALSLVAADLGVSMGKMGTEVAREASDIILLDDKFGNIVNAAEEGRNIYWTVRKSILYLLSTNLGELLVIIVALFVGLPLPLLATQIIWLNLVTDTFLVAALAVDTKEENLMNRTFRKPSKYIVDWFMGLRILMVSILMTIVTLWMFKQYVNIDMVKAWTVSLTILTVFQWYNIFNVRSAKNTIFSKDLFSNKYILLGLVAAIFLHLLAIYTPFMQKILHTTTLNWTEWGTILVITLSIVIIEEIRKFFYRIYLRNKTKPA